MSGKEKRLKILFCGSNLSNCFEGKIRNLSAAGNQFQNNLQKALADIGDVEVLSYINYQVDYNLDEIYEECSKEGIRPYIQCESVWKNFVNFRRALCAKIKEADIVVVYNILYPWFGLRRLAREYNVKTVAIVADFTSWKEQKSLPRKIYARLVAYYMGSYDKLVVLSNGVKKFAKKNQEIVTVNGGLKWSKFEWIPRPKKQDTINFVYTGGYSPTVGTDILIEAFKKIRDPNVRLYLAGQGGIFADQMEKISEDDDRICFLGFLARDQYYELLSKSHILVNPRNMNLEENAHNFPSKVLEYIATGRCILSTKFIGFEDYSDMIVFSESTVDGMYAEMKNLITFVRDHPDYYYDKNRTYAESIDWSNQAKKFL